MVPLRSVELYEVTYSFKTCLYSFMTTSHLYYDRPEQLWILNPKKILKRLDIVTSLELSPRNAEDAANKTKGN